MDAAPQSPSRVATGPATAANLPIWVLAGAFLGVLVGLFFGERAAVPQPVGVAAYSMMLESVIYPYILSSLIGGLGGLVRARAQVAYWLEGKARPSHVPRWNLLDNVIRPALASRL
jgi:hypothetical protein